MCTRGFMLKKSICKFALFRPALFRLDLIVQCTLLGGGGAVQPHFSPRHTEIWIWGWAKLEKSI